jgi:hypothetical protein
MGSWKTPLEYGHTHRMRPQERRSAPKSACALLAALAALAVLLASDPAQAAVQTVGPLADSYVKADQSTKNFGSRTTIRVDGSPVANGYLRFDVPVPTGESVTKATLKLWTNDSSGSGMTVHRVSDVSWGERTITYRNAPAIGTQLAASGSYSSGTYVPLDVTPAVSGGPVSFAVKRSSSPANAYNSREAGANPPELVVETTGGPPPPSSDPFIAVAGDIAGSGAEDEATAKLLDTLAPTNVLTTGDNAYESGTLAEFNSYYDPTWGRHKAKTYPTAGNHEYHTSGATGYFDYFGAAAGERTRGYYSFNVGTWHFVALNSNCSEVGGCGAGSPQEQWLRADLTANVARCTAAYWHHPRFSGGNYSDSSTYQPLWQALYDADAEIVLNGHDHNYQRYRPMDPAGNADALRGIREFVVGTGGRSHYALQTDTRREAGNGDTYGVLKLGLHPDSYDWEFKPEAGKTFTDSGSGACH